MTKDQIQKVRDALFNSTHNDDCDVIPYFEALAILDAALADDEKPAAYLSRWLNIGTYSVGKDGVRRWGETWGEAREWKPISKENGDIRLANKEAVIRQGADPTDPERTVEIVPLYLHPSSDAKDAARYRWLRDKARGGKLIRQIEEFGIDDEWVDTSMKGQP